MVQSDSTLVVYSITKDQREIINVLTKRMKMYIGVQGTVESLLGAIFEIYLRYEMSIKLN